VISNFQGRAYEVCSPYYLLINWTTAFHLGFYMNPLTDVFLFSKVILKLFTKIHRIALTLQDPSHIVLVQQALTMVFIQAFSRRLLVPVWWPVTPVASLHVACGGAGASHSPALGLSISQTYTNDDFLLRSKSCLFFMT